MRKFAARMKGKKNESIRRAYTYREFLNLFPFCTEKHQSELMEQLSKARKPMFLCGREVPDDLNLVSYGLLEDLSDIGKTKAVDPMARAIAMIMDLEPDQIYDENVFDVFAVGQWIKKEIDRINRLFKTISPNYSPQELAAGVRQMNFGSFGVLDWYAHRQGISDQNEVRDVAWIRIFTCMKMDGQRNEYEKRLNKEYSKSYKQNAKK